MKNIFSGGRRPRGGERQNVAYPKKYLLGFRCRIKQAPYFMKMSHLKNDCDICRKMLELLRFTQKAFFRL